MLLAILVLATPAGADCLPLPKQSGDVFTFDDRMQPRAQWSVQTEAMPLDLDGLATPVYRVPRLDKLGKEKEVAHLEWDLFLLRDGCAVALGTYAGHALPTVLAESKGGMRSFTVIRANPSPPPMCREHHDGCLLLTQYTFDGTRYAAGKPERR